MTAHVVAEATEHDGHPTGTCPDCDLQTCDLCGNHVGDSSHAWRDGWVCPACCPRCELVDGVKEASSMLAGEAWTDRQARVADRTKALADAIADGALSDDDIADVMRIES